MKMMNKKAQHSILNTAGVLCICSVCRMLEANDAPRYSVRPSRMSRREHPPPIVDRSPRSLSWPLQSKVLQMRAPNLAIDLDAIDIRLLVLAPISF